MTKHVLVIAGVGMIKGETATMDHIDFLFAGDAALVPPGRHRIRITQEGGETIVFETRTRRRLRGGAVRFYGEQIVNVV